jgi:hypothetical protein
MEKAQDLTIGVGWGRKPKAKKAGSIAQVEGLSSISSAGKKKSF